MAKPSYTIDAVNARLAAAHSRAKVEAKGDKLVLRATLPPKLGSTKSFPYQQRIFLGLPPTANGLAAAEGEALKLNGLLLSNTFDWGLYDKGKQKRSAKTVADWIVEFEKDYKLRHSLKDRSWAVYWARHLRRVKPQDGPLTKAVIMAAVESTKANTLYRQQSCDVLSAFCKFAGLEVNLKQYRGNYGPAKVTRKIPSDDEIVAAYDILTNPGWRWIYGVMAAFGLRPHEAFFCDVELDQKTGLYCCTVAQGKTGGRTVFTALPHDWVALFDLTNKRLPRIDAQRAYERGKLGIKAAGYLGRAGLPFTAYTLRHAWALRAINTLPPKISAELMGHSVSMHTDIYLKHITAAQVEAAVILAMGGGDG